MRPNLATLLLSLSVFSVPGLAGAQGIVNGKWSGPVTSPFGSTNQFTYSVSGSADSLSISVAEAAGGGSVPFSDIRLVGDTLRFTWPTGPAGAGLVCRLFRQESGAFEGTCSDAEGREGQIRMDPPAEHPPAMATSAVQVHVVASWDRHEAMKARWRPQRATVASARPRVLSAAANSSLEKRRAW